MAESVSRQGDRGFIVTDLVDHFVSYLGWHGRGNLGDDAIYDAVRSQLAGANLMDLPHLPRERIHSLAPSFRRRLRSSTLVVGGGTVIGRSNWRRLVERAYAQTRFKPGYAIGIGVEDPGFGGFRSYSEKDELAKWALLLSRFQTVSVRGPRSAELLAGVGVEVAVSGDPALLLPRPDEQPTEGLVGVNLGFGDDLWGHDPKQLAAEVASAVAQLGSHGYRFTGILMNPEDRQWTELALSRVTADIVLPTDANAAASEFARCSLVIVSRLHAGILAALSETPVISLEYQPKCRDFALSIDDERSLIRTDELTAAAVIDNTLNALQNAEDIRMRTRSAVSILQKRLESEYADARTQMGLSSNKT
jgi:polysaccharide pyruvyl transferase WcaK-like protein